MKKMVELHNVTKRFRQDTVLDNVNLELYDDKIYGFVGRNGSGKSVLFKLICGYLRPDEGAVTVEDRQLGEKYDFPEHLGALIEMPGFMWHESGYRNLRYLAKIQKRITDEDVKSAIRMVGLDPDMKKHVGKYSLGMKQRLGIAQAVMEKPHILVLDEPMNALDESGIEQMRELIRSYKAPERIILLASHSKEDIELLCDEVYEVKNKSVEHLSM
ncbi:MAG: ATP-binding cassette domain-containing protein [Wujia sp.]